MATAAALDDWAPGSLEPGILEPDDDDASAKPASPSNAGAELSRLSVSQRRQRAVAEQREQAAYVASFKQEEKLKLRNRASVKKETQRSYMEAHPEVNDIVNGLMTAILVEQPENIFRFASRHFSGAAAGAGAGAAGAADGAPMLGLVGSAGAAEAVLARLLASESHRGWFVAPAARVSAPLAPTATPSPAGVAGDPDAPVVPPPPHVVVPLHQLRDDASNGKFVEYGAISASLPTSLAGTALADLAAAGAAGVITLAALSLTRARSALRAARGAGGAARVQLRLILLVHQLDFAMQAHTFDPLDEAAARAPAGEAQAETPPPPVMWDEVISFTQIDDAFARTTEVLEGWYGDRFPEP